MALVIMGIAREALGWALLAALLLAPGCKHETGAAGQSQRVVKRDADANAASSSTCRRPDRMASFTLGTPGPSLEDGEEQLDVPYAVELGGVARIGEGFAIAALEPQSAGNHAVLTLLGADASSGRVVDLGLVHGDSAPPRVSSDGDELAVAIADNDAGGGIIRIAVVRGAKTNPEVDWGFDAAVGWDGTTAFDVALSGGRVALVFDKVAGGRRGVHVVGFSSSNPDQPEPAAHLISARGGWAESPRIVVRQGGFWAAWLERASSEQSSGEVGDDAGVSSALEVGQAYLKTRPLSPRGEPTGEAIAVHGSPARVFAFDLAASPDAGALVAWRQGVASPGVEQGFVHVARVRLDGTVTVRPIESEDVAAGVPTLLAPSDVRGTPWLVLHALSGSAQLALVQGDGLEASLHDEPAIGSADALLRNGDRLLVAAPRGRAIELSVVSCSVRAPRASSGGR